MKKLNGFLIEQGLKESMFFVFCLVLKYDRYPLPIFVWKLNY